MPTIFEKDGFRFFFYSNDHRPIHVHVRYGGGEAVLLDALLEEAQLDGTRYTQAYDGALLGFLAARYANEASAATRIEIGASV